MAAGKKVCMVFTNHSKLGDTGKPTGWYLPEGAHPYNVFKDAKMDITFASPKGGLAPLDPGSVEASKDDAACTAFNADKRLGHTVPLADVKGADYDAVFFVGGFGTMWDFPDDANVQRVSREVFEAGGVLSAVCHGPVALVNVKLSDGTLLVKGKDVTAFTNGEEDAVQLRSVVPFTCEDKFKQIGAKYSDGGVFQPNVAVAGRLITGQNPPSAGPCAEAVVGAVIKNSSSCITVGYHRIRGLGAPVRMMCYYKEQTFTNVSYGADMMETWFGRDKPELLKRNSCINLPYIIDGDTVVTQSNTCLMFLGDKLKIDSDDDFVQNHTVLDQVMDLRNDLMKIIYGPPYGSLENKAEFPDAAKKHVEGSAKGHFTKLEGLCKGPYMCGASPRSGDFHMFEMLDQHAAICKSHGIPAVLDGFPKLKALHAAMKAEPSLERYFESDFHTSYAQNNGLITHYTGHGPDFVYGPTVTDTIAF